MLTTEQVEEIANRVLREELGRVGFQRAEVRAGEDDTGERALFVIAHFGAGSGATPGRATGAAISALRSKLLDKGEERFPYVDLDYLGDERPEDLDDEPANAPSS